MPAMMAVGVARPSAHGQAITSTVTMASRPRVTSPQISQMTSVRTDMPMITGTKTAAIRSTAFWIGALEPCASRTIRMMPDRRVSPPTFSTRTVRAPCWLMVPA